jgi:hypothetical protein
MIRIFRKDALVARLKKKDFSKTHITPLRCEGALAAQTCLAQRPKH